MWRTDDKGEYILKNKENIPTLNDLILKETYVIDINLVYYDMISKNIKGYYGVISRITKPVEIGVEENNNNKFDLILFLGLAKPALMASAVLTRIYLLLFY